MLTKWSASRFKSIDKKQTLELRPLTILAGANSSGKSTILQTMLMLSQTLASKVERRQLLLNGELVRLGMLDEIISKSDGPKSFEVGFTAQPSLDLLLSSGRLARYPIGPWFQRGSLDAPEVTATLTFGTADGESSPETRQVELEHGSFSLQRGGKNTPCETFAVQRRLPAEVSAILHGAEYFELPKEAAQSALRYAITLPPSEPGEDPGETEAFDLETVGTNLEHFLPSLLLRKQSAVAARLLAAVGYRRYRPDAVGALRATGSPLDAAVAEAIQNTNDLSNADFRKALPTKIREIGKKYPEFASARTFTTKYPYETVAYTGNLISAQLCSLRYLGPLRSPPRTLHELGSPSDPKDVGTQGEYAAAVLDLFRSTSVQYVSPEGLPATHTLADAVAIWMRHFQLADAVAAEDAGTLGHFLRISEPQLGIEVDLTSVGVGVSQLLPIVVGALISDPGAVLLFEQPELHLHPRVQAALADFFLGVIRSGRQCIVETHSEHLINRLRRRIAESDSDRALSDLILLYFVERVNGQSNFRSVHVNEYGAIPDWPIGFFDEGPSEAERIMAAATKKRRARANRS